MDGLTVALVILIVVGGIGFFVPAFIAHDKNHPDKDWITICNIFFGATVLGWVLCLIWALSYKSVEKEQ